MDDPAAALLSNQIKRQDFFWSRNAGRQPGEKAILKGGAWPPGKQELHLSAHEAPKAPFGHLTVQQPRPRDNYYTTTDGKLWDTRLLDHHCLFSHFHLLLGMGKC